MLLRTVREWQQHCRTVRPGDAEIVALESDYFLAHCLDVSRAWLLAHADCVLTESQQQRVNAVLTPFASELPLSYVLGEAEFMGLPFTVSTETLIPRADTECMVDWLLQRYPAEQPLSVIDLGTGSGAIAVAIAVARPAWQVSMSDQSAVALVIATQNAERHAVQIHAHHGNWWMPLAEKQFDIVVSNPPYIAADDLALTALTAEPLSALVSEEDGLADIASILSSVNNHLTPTGCCVIEHGYQQGAAVRTLFRAVALQSVETKTDLAGRERFTVGFKEEKIQ